MFVSHFGKGQVLSSSTSPPLRHYNECYKYENLWNQIKTAIKTLVSLAVIQILFFFLYIKQMLSTTGN